MSGPEEIHRFEIAATWSGDGAGSGSTRGADGPSVAFAGATVLGGSGGKTNPEELLLTALGACFVNTWAIFLKKLGLAYAEPALRVVGDLGKDPAGGYRMERAVIHARVPASLLASSRAQIEKTLQLSEKYCIVSKVVRAAIPVEVKIEEI